jgi:spore coat protein H
MPGPRRSTRATGLLAAAAFLAVGMSMRAAQAPPSRPPVAPAPAQTPAPRALTQDELFQTTKIWTAHLTFSADQWRAMQPTRAATTAGRRFSGGEWLQGAPGNRNGWGAANGLVFHYAHADLEFADRQFRDVAVRFKGNGTYLNARGSDKVPFKVDLNKYVKGQKLAGVETLNFHNNITDPGWMNEVLAYRLYRDAGVPAPRSSYVRLYVTVVGLAARRYLGLYTLAENVDENFFQARGGSAEGALMKPVTVNPFLDLGDKWDAYIQGYDPKTDLTVKQQRRVIELCRLVSRASDADFAARIGTFIDLDAFARYYAVLVWINNIDSLLDRGQNFYLYEHPKSHLFSFVPWDQDHSFGAFASVDHRDYETGNIYKPWSDNIRFLARMDRVPAFRSAYLARMREFSGTIFTPDRFAAQVADLAPVIRPAVALESGRLPRFEGVVAGRTGVVPFTIARARSVVAQLARPR